MKKDWFVQNLNNSEGNNCILVSNYSGHNKVMNCPINIYYIEEYFDKHNDVGVWKIKAKQS